jgi:hypothetical protein
MIKAKIQECYRIHKNPDAHILWEEQADDHRLVLPPDQAG